MVVSSRTFHMLCTVCRHIWILILETCKTNSLKSLPSCQACLLCPSYSNCIYFPLYASCPPCHPIPEGWGGWGMSIMNTDDATRRLNRCLEDSAIYSSSYCCSLCSLLSIFLTVPALVLLSKYSCCCSL